MTIGYFLTSGYTSEFVSICANMHETGYADNPDLSASAYYWNTDISTGRLSVRIPFEHAYPQGGQQMYVYDSDDVFVGTFTTKTSADILTEGEWQNVKMSRQFFTDQYMYYDQPSYLKVFSDKVLVGVEGSGFSVDSESNITVVPSSYKDLNILGQFELHMFFDKIAYEKSNTGYCMGGSSEDGVAGEYITRYNMSTNDIEISERAQLTNDALSRYGSVGMGTMIYVFGGGTYSPFSASTDIYRYNKSSDTVSPVSINNLLVGRTALHSISKSSVKAYVLGGSDMSDTVTDVEQLIFSTDTVSPTKNADLNTSRQFGCTLYNNDRTWYVGGETMSGGSVTANLNSIERLNHSTDSVSTIVQTSTNKSLIRRMLGNGFSYVVGGGTSRISSGSNLFEKFDYATETVVASVSSKLIANVHNGVTFTNNEQGWYCGGSIFIGATPYEFNMLQKFDYATNTVMVERNILSNTTAYKDGATV